MKTSNTYTVTTSDWLKARENIKVAAYDPVLGLPISSNQSETRSFTQKDFESALKMASQRVATLPKSVVGKK